MLARMDTTQDIPSPCIRVCAVSARSGFCIGCGRKLGEISEWVGGAAATIIGASVLPGAVLPTHPALIS